MRTLTEANWTDVQNFPPADKPLLVMFWASWCGTCIETNYLQEFEEASGIAVGRVNTEENPDLSALYSILVVPTYLFFPPGKKIKRLIGLQSKESLLKLVDNHVNH